MLRWKIDVGDGVGALIRDELQNRADGLALAMSQRNEVENGALLSAAAAAVELFRVREARPGMTTRIWTGCFLKDIDFLESPRQSQSLSSYSYTLAPFLKRIDS